MAVLQLQKVAHDASWRERRPERIDGGGMSRAAGAAEMATEKADGQDGRGDFAAAAADAADGRPVALPLLRARAHAARRERALRRRHNAQYPGSEVLTLPHYPRVTPPLLPGRAKRLH